MKGAETMTEPATPHRRRTPCCQIEAFRYLTEHGYDVETPATPFTADDLLNEWVRMGDFPQPPGGWTVPRMIAAIASSPHPEEQSS